MHSTHQPSGRTRLALSGFATRSGTIIHSCSFVPIPIVAGALSPAHAQIPSPTVAYTFQVDTTHNINLRRQEMQSNSLNLKFVAAFARLCAWIAVLTLSIAIVPAQAQNINFPAPSTFVATQPPGCTEFCGNTTGVVLGDFNGDGNLDVLSLDGSSLNVALGNGNGTFQTPIYTGISAPNYQSNTVEVGDFNGDKILDLAVWGTNSTTGTMQLNIYLGTGNGNFNAGAVYNPTGSNDWAASPTSLVVQDVNGDGKLDIVALTQYNGVYIFIGNGDGTFQTPANYSTYYQGDSAGGVAVADVNDDGHPDLAVTIGNGMEILLNNGKGTFAAPVYYANGYGNANGSGSGIAIGTLTTGSKYPDVVASVPNAGAVVFLNQGNGTFVAGSTLTNPNIGGTANIILADINNDKKLDAVIPDSYGDVFTFTGKGNGTFNAGVEYSTAVYGGTSLAAIGDFNKDGTLDLLATAGNSQTNTISFGRGDGTFRTAQAYGYAGPAQAQNMVVADFNGDGFADVAAQGLPNGTIGVILGSSHGALTAQPKYVTACSNEYVYGIAAGDVNGDGKQDLVATLGGSSATCNHMVAVMIGKGTGSFDSPKYYPTGAASTAQEMQIYLVDVNGDGKLDIVTSNSDGSISVLLNKGTGSFEAPILITSINALNPADNPLTFADFNGDGKIDIAAAANQYAGDHDVYVLLGNGNGTFQSPIATNAGYNLQGLVAGDFNKDGKQDLFVVTNNWGCSGTVGGGIVGYGSGYQYLQGNGAGGFSVGPQICVGPSNPQGPVAADFNADGNLDVAIPYYGTNAQYESVLVLQGTGTGTFTANQQFYAGYDVASIGVGDFNGDGMPDIGLLNFDSGFSVLLNETQPVSISPLTVNFGSETVGKTKSETIILTNDQATSLSITSFTIGGTNASDFTETNTCGTSRKAGWDCTITVKFDPAATGTRSGTLTIKDGAGTQTVQLNGTGS